MMGKGHAVSGATVWLTGWGWASLAGLAHPHLDVLTVGTLVCAGAALAPDIDHPESRIANSAGLATRLMATVIGLAGRGIHKATKLDADRPDEDGHRTITHTIVGALFAGLMVTGIAGLSDDLGAWMARASGLPIAPLGKLLTALLVYVYVRLGYAAARSFYPGRQSRVRIIKALRRQRKATVVAFACAAYAYIMVPADVWWLGLAVGIGCFAHLLGDVITALGCPILWPLPVPSRTTKYNRKTRQREPVTQWRTWYLVGTPKWMRFRVGSATETKVTWWVTAFGIAMIGVLVYAGGWGPGAS